MNESNEFARLENQLRSQSLGISPPDVSALIYRCGQAAAQEAASRRFARRHWTQVGLAMVVALAGGIALDRTALTSSQSTGVNAHMVAVPSLETPTNPQPERDTILPDPRILRASSRWFDGLELADLRSNVVRTDQRDDADDVTPVFRVLDFRDQLREPLNP